VIFWVNLDDFFFVMVYTGFHKGCGLHLIRCQKENRIQELLEVFFWPTIVKPDFKEHYTKAVGVALTTNLKIWRKKRILLLI
jgi:hypothetical protein